VACDSDSKWPLVPGEDGRVIRIANGYPISMR
jgi:hypothetical protein